MQNGTSGTVASIAQRDRERQRERERSQRAAVAAAATTSLPGMTGVETSGTGLTVLPEFGKPIFGEPTTEDEEDETSKKIKAVLGSFSDFAATVIKNNHSDHPHLTVISNREENRRKVEQIFSEMKKPFEPLTGLDDLDELSNHGASSTFFTNNNSSTSRKYPPGTSNAYTNSNSHQPPQSIINDTQQHPRKSQWPTSTSTPPKVYPPYQQPPPSSHHLPQTSHYPPAAALSSVPSSGGISNHNNSINNNLSSLSDSDEGLGPSIHSSITNSTVKVTDILAEAAKDISLRKRKISPLPPQAPQINITTTGPLNLLANATLTNNKPKTNATTKLSQPPPPTTAPPPSSKPANPTATSSDDDSDASSSDDSDDDDSDEKSSEESSDDGDSSDSSDSAVSRTKKSKIHLKKLSKLSKKQSSLDSTDSMGLRGDSSIPIPSSAGLGPPTNAIGNDEWDLDNFILSDNKPKQPTTTTTNNSATNNNTNVNNSNNSSTLIYSRDTQAPISNNNSSSKNNAQGSSSSSSNKGQTSRYRQNQTNNVIDQKANSRTANRFGPKPSAAASRLSDMEEGEVDSDPEAAEKEKKKSSTNSKLLNTLSSSEDSLVTLDPDPPEPYDPSHGKMDIVRNTTNSKANNKYVPSPSINRSKVANNNRIKPDPSPPPVPPTTNGHPSSSSLLSNNNKSTSRIKKRSETPTKQISAKTTKATKASTNRSTKSTKVPKVEPPLSSAESPPFEDHVSITPVKVAAPSSTIKQSKASSSRAKSKVDPTPLPSTSLLSVPLTNNRSNAKSAKAKAAIDESLLQNNQENIENSTNNTKAKSTKRSSSNSLPNDKETKRKANNVSKVSMIDHTKHSDGDERQIPRPDELKINIELHKLTRIPCIDRNGNTSANSRMDYQNDSNKSTPTKKEEQSKANRSTKESTKGSSKIKHEDDSKPPKDIVCSIPLSSTKKGLSNSTPNKKSTKVEDLSDHYSSNSREYHFRNNAGTSPQIGGSSLLAKSSPIIARSSPVTTNNRSDSSVNSSMNRSTDAFPVSAMFQPLHEHDALNKAKGLKRNADRETDRHQQMSQYIEAVLFFVQTGMGMEMKRSESELDKAFQMYKETLNLLKQTTNKFSKAAPLMRPGGNTPDMTSNDVKLTVFSYRCQALLILKLNRMKQKEMHENKELISGFMSEPSIQSVLGHHSSSSSSPVQIPQNTLQACSKQLTLLQQFQTVIELWSKSELMIEKNPQAKDWFASLNGSDVGALMLSSTFEHLINYTLNGIRNLNL